MDVDDDARTIGRRLRQIRNYRRKSLRMVAGLASLTLPPTNADTAGMIGW